VQLSVVIVLPISRQGANHKIGIIGGATSAARSRAGYGARAHQVWVALSLVRAPRAPRPRQHRATVADLARRPARPRGVTVRKRLVAATWYRAIPLKNIPASGRPFFSRTPASAVVVDTGNYYPSSATASSTRSGRDAGDPLGRATARAAGGRHLTTFRPQHLASEAGRRAPRTHRPAVAGRRRRGQSDRNALVDQLASTPSRRLGSTVLASSSRHARPHHRPLRQRRPARARRGEMGAQPPVARHRAQAPGTFTAPAEPHSQPDRGRDSPNVLPLPAHCPPRRSPLGSTISRVM